MKFRRRAWLRLGWLAAAGVLVFMLLRWFEHSQVYHPTRLLEATGAELGRPFEDVRFRAVDGIELNGWYFRVATNSPRARLAILVCHGNGGNISHRLELCDVLLGTGASVFVFDYRGYGRSAGRPSEEGTYQDGEAAYEWLRSRGFAGGDIVAMGESLGGAVAAELACHKPLGGLILQSTFTSMPDIGAEVFPWLPVRLLHSIEYNTCEKLPRINIPVLVMHSRMDDLISFRHAEKNFAAVRGPKLLCEIGGRHNDPLADRQRFVRGIEDFLGLVKLPSQASP